ncbi:acetyltransferase [Escherichia coli]|nr:acetyltransferase [Escherichia coli]
MVDKHEEITLPIVLSCNYQSDITGEDYGQSNLL